MAGPEQRQPIRCQRGVRDARGLAFGIRSMGAAADVQTQMPICECHTAKWKWGARQGGDTGSAPRGGRDWLRPTADKGSMPSSPIWYALGCAVGRVGSFS